MSECLLREAIGRPPVECEEVRCTFWRFVEQADLATGPEPGGCAIQHFALLEGGEGVAAWLLSVKERIEGVAAESAAPGSPEEVIDPRD